MLSEAKFYDTSALAQFSINEFHTDSTYRKTAPINLIKNTSGTINSIFRISKWSIKNLISNTTRNTLKHP